MLDNLENAPLKKEGTPEDNAETNLSALAETDPELAQVIVDLNEAELQFSRYKEFFFGSTEWEKEHYVLPDNIQNIVVGLKTCVELLKEKKAELERARKENPQAYEIPGEVGRVVRNYRERMSEATPAIA